MCLNLIAEDKIGLVRFRLRDLLARNVEAITWANHRTHRHQGQG